MVGLIKMIWVALEKVFPVLANNREKVFQSLRKKLRPRNPAPTSLVLKDIQTINNIFEGEVEIHREIRGLSEIRLQCEGNFDLPSSLFSLKETIKKQHEMTTKSNDPHAILSCDPSWQDNPVVLRYYVTDYITVKTLREAYKAKKYSSMPRVLSACGLFVCSESKELILNRRAHDVDTFKNCLHTFGGAFIPEKYGTFINHDRENLINTLKREIFEEANIDIVRGDYPMLLMEEIDEENGSCFIQLVCSGINISKKELDNIRENWEGRIVRVSLEREAFKAFLENTQENWVTTGKVHILMWLAINAPPYEEYFPGLGKSTREFFELFLPQKG